MLVRLPLPLSPPSLLSRCSQLHAVPPPPPLLQITAATGGGIALVQSVGGEAVVVQYLAIGTGAGAGAGAVAVAPYLGVTPCYLPLAQQENPATPPPPATSMQLVNLAPMETGSGFVNIYLYNWAGGMPQTFGALNNGLLPSGEPFIQTFVKVSTAVSNTHARDGCSCAHNS